MRTRVHPSVAVRRPVGTVLARVVAYVRCSSGPWGRDRRGRDHPGGQRRDHGAGRRDLRTPDRPGRAPRRRGPGVAAGRGGR
ncbi:hypothetical protein Ae331Ps2_4990c [Pseudonocardia sp. Ae331_Ps2]|nr:hypothetical protein Ae331Ps2_4990c [Pseudonocardia sp. Ae331_Ps2]